MAAGKQPGFALLDDRIAYSWGSDEEFVLDRALSGANRLSREGSPSPAPIVGLPRRWSDNNFATFDNGRNFQGSATAAPALLPQTPSRSHRSFLLATSRPPVIAGHPQRPTVVRGRRALQSSRTDECQGSCPHRTHRAMVTPRRSTVSVPREQHPNIRPSHIAVYRSAQQPRHAPTQVQSQTSRLPSAEAAPPAPQPRR